jgi:hypothetical protein
MTRRVHDAHEHGGDEDDADHYLLADARGHNFLSPRLSLRFGSGTRLFPPGYKIMQALEIPAATQPGTSAATKPGCWSARAALSDVG